MTKDEWIKTLEDFAKDGDGDFYFTVDELNELVGLLKEDANATA